MNRRPSDQLSSFPSFYNGVGQLPRVESFGIPSGFMNHMVEMPSLSSLPGSWGDGSTVGMGSVTSDSRTLSNISQKGAE